MFRHFSIIVLWLLPYIIYSQNKVLRHDTLPPQLIKNKSYELREQRQLSWILQHDTTIEEISIHTRRSRLSHYTSTIKAFSIDSVYCLPDSIMLLRGLKRLDISGNGLQYISPNLSMLSKLAEIEYLGFGESSGLIANIPLLISVKKVVISISDSITIAKVLASCINIRILEIHLEAPTNWDFSNMLQHNKKLKHLTIAWWEGNAPESNRKYALLGDESVGYDTMGVHYQYIDIDLSHCKHLRKIVTDYELSEEMQRYCRRHWIRVVKFSRKRFRKKE